MSKSKAATLIYPHQRSSAFPLIAPEVLLPLQYDMIFARNDLLTPHQRLVLAILENALHDFLRYRHLKGKREKRLFREALEWFTTPDEKGIFSFGVVCQSLGLEPEYIRRGLSISSTDRQEKSFPS
jgi:hypothetical protein